MSFRMTQVILLYLVARQALTWKLKYATNLLILGRSNVAAISHTTFSNAISSIKTYEIQMQFHSNTSIMA